MASGDDVLTLRQLNRATLARQMLLRREPLAAGDAIAHLGGLQAQQARPPFIGLWTRLEDFERDELADLIARREVVRATMMRHTLHLVTAADYLRFRAVIQPALTRSFDSIAGARTEGLDLERLLEAARGRLAEGPSTFAELRELVAAVEPERDPSALGYAVRSHLQLVQVADGAEWGFGGSPAYIEARDWLGEAAAPGQDPRELIRRYLGAFGPAAVRDVQAWSGLAGLKADAEALRPELRTFRDERGRELLDLPDAPLPPPDTPAPPRFLPDFDNLMVGHAARTRLIADEHRPRVYRPGARVLATVLLDGVVAATWSVERKARAATLTVEPFGRLARTDRAALRDEGARMLRFSEPRAERIAVRFA